MTIPYPHRLTCDLDAEQARFLAKTTHQIFLRTGRTIAKVDVVRALLSALRRSQVDLTQITTAEELEELMVGRMRIPADRPKSQNVGYL